MLTPSPRLAWPIRLGLSMLFIFTTFYTVLLVIPAYTSGLYQYTDTQIIGSPGNGVHIPSYMHMYDGRLGTLAAFIFLFVPIPLIPLTLLSVPVRWRTFTVRERRLWIRVAFTVLFIIGVTWRAAYTVFAYIAD